MLIKNQVFFSGQPIKLTQSQRNDKLSIKEIIGNEISDFLQKLYF